MAAAAQLELEGYVVLPLPDYLFDHFDVATFLTQQIEFVNPTVDSIKVMGAFGAFGNPSSFHHKDLRRLRNGIYDVMYSFWAELHPHKWLTHIPDRFSVRRQGTSTTAESWHQDVSAPYWQLGERVIYGGWVNLDADQTQYFSCIPRSHRTHAPTASGFQKFSKEQSQAFDNQRMQPGVPIPPRHCIVFNEILVHEVKAHHQKADSYRLYLKYCVANTRSYFRDTWGDIITHQMQQLGVPPYHVEREGSYTFPKMYGPMHVNMNGKPSTLHRIEDFTQTLKPQFWAPPRKDGKFRGAIWVEQILPSLRNVGISARYLPPYHKRELRYYSPMQLVPGVYDGGWTEDEDDC